MAGEGVNVAKLSGYELALERVRLLGVIAQNGTGGEEGGSFAEDFGPTAERPQNPAVGTQYFDTDLLRLVVWDGSGWRWVAAVDRKTLVYTTPLLAPGAADEPAFAIGVKTMLLLTAALNFRGRVTDYWDDDVRDADLGRAWTADLSNAPEARRPDILFDVNLLPERLVWPVAEDVMLGFGMLLLRITNTGTVARALTLTLTYLPLEEV